MFFRTNTTGVETVKCDVVVVGGGLEGSLLARALQQSGQQVVLLDPGRPREPDAPYDLWVNTPFLMTPTLWEWTQWSLPFWREIQVLGERDGLAVAPRESVSWLRLQASLEDYRLRPSAFETGLFPEWKASSELGQFLLPDLPVLRHQGLVARCWQELERQGVRIEADCPVGLIDWEHDWPTAVARGQIFRGRRLILCAGPENGRLWQRELPELQQRQLWLEGAPRIEDRRPLPRPVVWVHYARAPLYLVPGSQRWGLVRLQSCEDDGAERRFLGEARQRWLRCEMEDMAHYELKVDGLPDGLPMLDYHPWRQDCQILAGMGQQNWIWLPELIRQLVESPPLLVSELSQQRLVAPKEAPAAAH